MKCRSLGFVALLPLTTVSIAQTGEVRDYVLTNKEAVLMLPPELVSGPMAAKVCWTKDGSSIVVLRFVLEINQSILAAGMNQAKLAPQSFELISYNLKSKKTRTLLKSDSSEGMIDDVEALSAKTVLVSTHTFGETRLHRYLSVNTETAKSNFIAEFAEGVVVGTSISPTKDLGLIYALDTGDLPAGKTPEMLAAYFTSEGRRETAFTVPQFSLEWNATGETAVATSFRRDPATKKIMFTKDKKPVRDYFILDRTKRTLVPTEPVTLYDQQANEPEFRITQWSVSNPNQTNPIYAPSVLISPSQEKDPIKNRGLVTTDGRRGLVAPGNGAVAFESQGSVFVRQFLRVDKALYEEAVLAALKTKILSRAKQCGLAIIMNSTDNDDRYIGAGADLQSQLGPYLKDNSLLEGLVYTFAGGLATAIENVASTELGYIPGPGGRAVIYADGHVKWRTDKP